MIAESKTSLATELEESTQLSDTIAPPIEHALILDRLADVTAPAEPTLWPLFAIAGALFIMLALSYLLIYRRQRRRQSTAISLSNNNAQQALEKLAIVESSWANGDIDAREAAYRLSTLLRLGLNLPQLKLHCSPSTTASDQAWQQTLAMLNQLRYQPDTTQQLTSETFEQLRLWLSASQHASQAAQDV